MYPPKDAAVADATVAVRYEHPAIVREREREKKKAIERKRERETGCCESTNRLSRSRVPVPLKYYCRSLGANFSEGQRTCILSILHEQIERILVRIFLQARRPFRRPSSIPWYGCRVTGFATTGTKAGGRCSLRKPSPSVCLFPPSLLQFSIFLEKRTTVSIHSSSRLAIQIKTIFLGR